MRPAQVGDPVGRVEWVHLQRSHVDQEPGPDELVVQPMVAQHVADVLTQITLDALAKFLHAIDVFLRHAPGAVGRVGRARIEFFDSFFDFVIPRNVGHQIFFQRKSFHRLDGYRLVNRQSVHPRHAHQLRHAVDFRRARAAFARLAVPAASQISGLLTLNL